MFETSYSDGYECAPWVRSANPSDSWALVTFVDQIPRTIVRDWSEVVCINLSLYDGTRALTGLPLRVWLRLTTLKHEYDDDDDDEYANK